MKISSFKTPGLTSPEAAQRLAQFGPNELPPEKTPALWQRFAGQYEEPLSLMLLPAAGIAAAMGHWPDAAGIAGVSLANASIGCWQEVSAQNTMEALRQLSGSQAQVLRDGQVTTLPSRQLVPGDVILIRPGDVVPADAVLLESQNLHTDEAALTGESEPVAKDHSAQVPPQAPLHQRKNMVFSGTPVKMGTGTALVTTTGSATEVGKIALSTQAAEQPPTPLDRQMGVLANQFLTLGGVSAVLIGGAEGLATGNWMGAASTAISTTVAVVPESLPTVSTLLKTHAVNLAKERNVLIRKLSSVESLGSTSVICTDKTGTLTTGEMTGREVWSPSFGSSKNTLLGALLGSTAHLQGSTWTGSSTEIATLKYIAALPGLALQVLEDSAQGQRLQLSLGPNLSQDFLTASDKLPAIQQHLQAGELAPAILALAKTVQESGGRDYPFSSERKLHTVAISGASLGQEGYQSFTTGALARILSQTQLTPEQKQEVMAKNDDWASRGYRVIGLASRQSPVLGETEQMESQLEFAGLMAIQDPLRSGVAESVAELRGAGIRVKVITGDQLLTAKSIGEEAGILEPQKNETAGVLGGGAQPPLKLGAVLSEEQLEQSSDRQQLEQWVQQAHQAQEVVMAGKWLDLFQEEQGTFGPESLAQLIDKAAVFYRVEPRHKLKIVETLQKSGQTVAMTGDGVNDAPAIKKADIGIAMGIRGTEATREAADMVLLDDSFNSIAQGVQVGRQIRANLGKVVKYTVSSNLSEIVAMGTGAAVGLATGAAVPALLTPLQILWINLVTDSLPSLGIGMEKAEGDLMKQPVVRPEGSLVNSAEWKRLALVGGYMGLAAAGLYLVPQLNGSNLPQAVAQTMAFNFLATSQCANALNARQELSLNPLKGLGENKMLMASLAGTVALQAALPMIPYLGPALRATPLGLEQWALVGGLAASVIPVGMLAKKIFPQETHPPSGAQE